MERLSIEVVENATKTVSFLPETPFEKVLADCMTDYLEMRKSEEQGLLLRLDSKDELIEVLASKLLNEQFGACYMCKNPMKNITLDGVHNGCDGECNLSEEHTVDDFIKKIVGELERNKQIRH